MRTRVTDEIIKDTLLNNYPKSKNINISRLKIKGSTRIIVEFDCGLCDSHNKSHYSNIKKGRACKKCGYRKLSKKTKIYTKDIIEKELLQLNFKWLNSNDYIDANSILETECLICGKISKANATSRIINKRKCSKCNGFYKRDISEIKLEFDILGNNEYEILSEEYVNAGNKLLVKHKVCGNEYYVSRRNFRKGRRCPKCKISKGEFKVSDFLERNKIEFEKEKKYDYLVGIGGGKLRFDFYLPKQNILIEYDGELHYKETSLGNNLKYQKCHDELKNIYCKENNIKLIRIPYWEFDNIETILSNELLN